MTRRGVMMAKRAFSHCADEYAAYRPDYPAELFTLLADAFGTPAGRTAVDAGAGTGIFSRQLAETGWKVIATDADPVMLGRIAPSARPIRVVAATAEQLPFADGSIHLVTAAQAFHWFNPPVALAEFARVLRPGGGLAFVWNNRVAERSTFVRNFDSLIRQFNPAYRREYRQQDWAEKIEASGSFSKAERHAFQRTWRLEHDTFVSYTRSVSYLRNVLSESSRRDFEAALRSLMTASFADRPCEIPLRTDAWLATRKVR